MTKEIIKKRNAKTNIFLASAEKYIIVVLIHIAYFVVKEAKGLLKSLASVGNTSNKAFLNQGNIIGNGIK